MYEFVNTTSLILTWSKAPWDEVVCGFPVLQITNVQVLGNDANIDIRQFARVRDKLDACLVSCRLPHDSLKESMLLEEHGFRFIEMVLFPELDLAGFNAGAVDRLLPVSRATESDMPRLLDIARAAFLNERFKMDHRLDPAISDQRFCNWVNSSLRHPTQELYTVKDGSCIVAFFVIESLSDGTCYWHLNAVAPDAQGQGYGRCVWLSMLDQAARAGAKRVRSSIAARNHRVLNLYAKLGFSFLPPMMTFHWVRPKQ
jgi:RimJ/RimL family protein N-acetyltransferase